MHASQLYVLLAGDLAHEYVKLYVREMLYHEIFPKIIDTLQNLE
jgi:hypothetical protein